MITFDSSPPLFLFLLVESGSCICTCEVLVALIGLPNAVYHPDAYRSTEHLVLRQIDTGLVDLKTVEPKHHAQASAEP